VERGRGLRAARRDLHPRGHLCRSHQENQFVERAWGDCDRAHAAFRLSGEAELGLRRRAALRAGLGLRPPGGAQGADRRGARQRPDGAPRRRLQPLRPEGELPAALRAAVLHRAPQDAVGRGDRLLQPGRAPLLRAQRPLLAGGVLVRRAALRCGPRHHRRLEAPHRRRDPRLGAARQAPGARERRQPGALHRARALHRAVERRFPPRLPRARHGRVRRLLRRLRRCAGQASRALARRRVRVPGRGVPVQQGAARRAERAPAAVLLRRLPAEPRPDRQPGSGRKTGFSF